jgi:hypothetical protein
MISFHEWLDEQLASHPLPGAESDDRPTRHRVFPTFQWKSDPGEDDFLATDPSLAYRLLTQPQIDDIRKSGFVRARIGKMKGGRTGETHWSQGGPGGKYAPQGGDGVYILVTRSEGLHDRIGGLPKSELVRVMRSVGHKWVDVTDSI